MLFTFLVKALLSAKDKKIMVYISSLILIMKTGREAHEHLCPNDGIGAAVLDQENYTEL